MTSVYYAECHKSHSDLGGKADGCLEFKERTDGWSSTPKCNVCGCHRNFHRKVVERQVYTNCHKNHDLKIPNSVDGCQEFTPGNKYDDYEICAVCGCHKGFHSPITKLTST